jgi:Xaa-Pro dipeptidase
MHKSAAELALMQRASDITIAAFKAAFATLQEGMTKPRSPKQLLAALERVGGEDPWALVGFAILGFPTRQRSAAAPEAQRHRPLGLGCAVEVPPVRHHAYHRLRNPSARQTEVWNLERRAQDAASPRPGWARPES